MRFCVLFKYWMFAGLELNDKAKHKKKTKHPKPEEDKIAFF